MFQENKLVIKKEQYTTVEKETNKFKVLRSSLNKLESKINSIDIEIENKLQTIYKHYQQ